METKKQPLFSLKTASGTKRLIAVFIAVILIAALCAQFISTDGGRIKISTVSFDVNGASLKADLYYPDGTSSENSLPAIVVNHGGGVSKGVVRGIAEELARRGFVVLNINAYTAGTSETAASTDPSLGVLDAVNYLRAMEFVDSERIGVVGHSAGSTRVAKAAMADNGAYSLNDRLINILYETFGVALSEEEINEDADTLAAQYLNDDQFALYETLKADTVENYNTSVRSVCIIGSNGKSACILETVTVAGYEVQRNYPFNLCIINGDYDTRSSFPTADYAKSCFYTGEDNVTNSVWYVLNDATSSSTVLGSYEDLNVLNSAELADAFAARTVRVHTTNPETHSKNFFSAQTATDVVKFCTQALNYNNGELGNPNAVADDDINYIGREVCTLISMLGMVGMLICCVAAFVRKKFYADCILPAPDVGSIKTNKLVYWLTGIVDIILVFLAIYIANNTESGPNALIIPVSNFFPLGFATDTQLRFVFMLGGFTLIPLAGAMIYNKLKNKDLGIKRLGLKIGIKGFLKSLLLSYALLFIGYMALAVIEYLFNQDFRFWSTSFTELRAEYWLVVPRYALLVFPAYLICGALTNYTIREDIPGWLDDILAVVIGSAGIWLCAIVNIIVAKAHGDGTLFASFIMTYSTLLFVPIVTAVNRLVYRITHSIWLGAMLSSVLFAWCAISSAGMEYAQTALSSFLGF